MSSSRRTAAATHAEGGPRVMGATTSGRWAVRLAAGFALLAAAGWIGCGQEDVSRPEDTPTNVITAVYQSPQEFERGMIELNGERLDLEWGGEFTPELPFTQVRLSAAEGSGSPGGVQYVAVKAIYTNTHLYMLLQWVDPAPNALKDIFVYTGPDLGRPIVHCTAGVCDTTYRTGPQDSLLLPAWWTQLGEDDKIALAFEMDEAEGLPGEGSFRENGCQVACHTTGPVEFGATGSGRLDVWYWLAGRTNPVRNIFNPGDDPEDPRQGTPGYMDDWYTSPAGGLVTDPGQPGYFPNFEPGSGVPRHPYRRVNDRLHEPINPATCVNRFLQSCVSNNGVQTLYLWREQAATYYPPFAAIDTLFEGNIPADARRWVPGDIVPGYVLTYPSESRADVRASGGHEEEAHVWTLEVARRLNTGDPDHDVIFEPESGRLYYFTIAVFDADVRNHWGSEPQILRFGPKDPR